MTTMFHGEIDYLFVKSGRNDNGDEIRLVLGERLRRSGVELIAAKPQLSLGLAEHSPVDVNGAAMGSARPRSLSGGSTAVHRCCHCLPTPIWIY